MKPPYAIGSVPRLSGHAIAYRWRSLPRVRRHRASKPQGSSKRVLPWQVTMDQLIFASFSHTHYWYEVGMLKVPAVSSKSMDQPSKVANPARGQLNRENDISLSPFVPGNLVSRDGFGSPVPRQPAHLHTQAESGTYLRDSSRFPRRRPFNYFNRHALSCQSRVYRVTQLRTDGVHCRESAGTGPVNLTRGSSSNGCCLSRSHHGQIKLRLSFPIPTVGMKWVCSKYPYLYGGINQRTPPR